ncbi:master DNA invertase Mpi family serine-type recombinase [Treponema sp.]|uniref:master DNA invertase Mpi family serine-type recombinase n=1 Tax=Treponema sp. TaxID=166 RepID=UPI00298E10D4|nr:master DNA invertase Mpi family serine-type recombinase [Treponema sp.]MCR5613160.1 master DNA invertase Mpi family serine-type recombinase [Treponema sp.]
MYYGYIRVSTDRQTVENQRFEINSYCQKMGIKIDRWIEEKISGTKTPDKRRLGDLLKCVEHGDKIICSELSRLGRNLFMIMSILNLLMEKGAVVYTIKDRYVLGDDIQSKVLAFAFGLSAEIERNLISQRTAEALRMRRNIGKKLGRPKGQAQKVKLSCKRELTQELLALRIPKAKIARIMGVTVQTLYNFIDRDKLFVPDVY